MQLSKNFTLEELTKSQTAERKGISNNPSADAIYNLKILAEIILQPIRNKWGSFLISSGYRSEELCLEIGSKSTSHHCCNDGYSASDFEVAGVDNYELAVWIRDESNLPYCQLILECYNGQKNSGWLHISYHPEDIRKECLTYGRTQGYRKGLLIK
jgi:hypothetical protein